MLPELTPDTEYIQSNWPEDCWKEVEKIIEAVALDKLEYGIPVYSCEDYWVKLGVFKEFNGMAPMSDYFEYGYCDTQESLRKYLQPLIESEENYFVTVGGMSMDNEKYYKQGTYINKYGVDTGEDYWPYIEAHPEMKIEQEFNNKWLTFSIRKLIK